MRRVRILTVVAVVAVVAAIGGLVGALAAGSSPPHARDAAPTKATGALVSVDGPAGQFQRNLQALPMLAVDPVKPRLLVATANDLMDMQACSKKAAITTATCQLPATPLGGGDFDYGVGMSAVYFSFDRGHRWIQPTYHGLTAAGCSPTVEPCKAMPGLIHTVPNYYEHGLRTRGDSSVAFGPVLRNGKFSWANGTRLYLSTTTTNLNNTVVRPGRINSTSTMTVSYLDNPTPGRVTKQSNWSAPIIVPKREPAISMPTEDQIWADNASSSRFFGNVYMCYNDIYTPAKGNSMPIYPTVAASSDGGLTWTVHRVAPPIDSARQGYRFGCAIRTDSHGAVYAFFTHFPGTFPSTGLSGAQTMVKSSDGGATWTRPVNFMKTNTGCFYWDPVGIRCSEDGPGGDPNEYGPSVDIANGAPTGAGATNEIAFAWTDGRYGQNHEAALLTYSMNQGKTWSAPVRVSVPSDRVMYSAVAIAPDGSRMYLTYNAITTPFTRTTAKPRLMHGVLRSAVIGRGGAPAGWTTDYIGRSGDARGTSFADWNYEEFLGFYVFAVATRSYGAGVWTDVSRAADCPAIDKWRETSLKAKTIVVPAPWPLTDCPARFGNSDIWSATTAP